MKFFTKKSKYNTSDVLKRINGRMIKYVSHRDENNVETIIGRGGRIVVTDKEIAVNCDGKDVFVCPRELAQVSELLSLNGVIVECIENGIKRSVTAYYNK